MPRIIIQRANEFNNRFRDYGIYIDGQKVETISNGEAKELKVEAGRHTIVSKIDWCSSPEISFEIAGNETRSFRVGSFRHGKWLTPVVVAILVFYMLSKSPDRYLILLAAIVPFSILVYYISFGRKKYLSLEQTEFSPFK